VRSPIHVSVAKGSGPALAERARGDFGSARSRRAGSDFQTGAEEITTRITCDSRRKSQRFIHEFGGRVEKLPRDWLKRFARKEKPKPLRIGKRLLVVRSPTRREAVSFPYSLIVPAGAAFGTGEHATTAMSLRLLEEVTRRRKPNSLSILEPGAASSLSPRAAWRGAYRRH